MKKIALLILTLALTQGAPGQVDVESRRTLDLQTSFPLKVEEPPIAFGYHWFNQNNYPWTNTALRVIFAGIFGDVELSCFLPANTNIAIGAGLSFRAIKDFDWLISYGYGINAIRDGTHGGHEIGLAVQKQF